MKRFPLTLAAVAVAALTFSVTRCGSADKCTAATCNGCCREGNCYPGTEDNACGSGAAKCESCTATGKGCYDKTCRSGPGTDGGQGDGGSSDGCTPQCTLGTSSCTGSNLITCENNNGCPTNVITPCANGCAGTPAQCQGPTDGGNTCVDATCKSTFGQGFFCDLGGNCTWGCLPGTGSACNLASGNFCCSANTPVCNTTTHQCEVGATDGGTSTDGGLNLDGGFNLDGGIGIGCCSGCPVGQCCKEPFGKTCTTDPFMCVIGACG